MHTAHARYARAAPSDDELVTRHAPLVDRVARRLAARTGGTVSPDDLWSAGAMGLVDAARRFDPGRDVKFETFAERRIRGAMLDEMRRMDHLPRRLRAQVERVERARTRLAQRLGREAEPAEIASALGLGSDEVEALEQLGLPHVTALEELVSALPHADELVSQGEAVGALAAAVAGLSDRLQLLLSLHYEQGLTYREIARILGVSEPRVCQLHAEAVAALRRRLPRSGDARDRQAQAPATAARIPILR